MDPDTSAVRIVQRTGAGLVAVLIPFAGVLTLVPAPGAPPWSAWNLVLALGPGAVAALCAWFALRGQYAESRDRMVFAAKGGAAGLGIGLVAGFVIPVLIDPSANQGPIFGVFLLAPLGFAAGVLFGAIYAPFRGRRAATITLHPGA